MAAWALAAAVTAWLIAGPAAAGNQAALGAFAASASGAQPSLAARLPRRNPLSACFFRVLPYLTHVTSSSIRVNVVPESSFEVRAALSRAADTTWGTVGLVSQTVTADVRTHLTGAASGTFTGLTAGGSYRYLVECRANATSPWQSVYQGHFKTLETSTTASVRVAVMADSHVGDLVDQYHVDSTATLEQARENPGYGATLRNMLTRGPDFLLDLGDSAMPHSTPSSGYTYLREDGTSRVFTAGDADDQSEVDDRYEVYLAVWQPVLAVAPLFLAVGNHEEIQGYGGVGDTQACQSISENETNRALTGYLNMLGNYSDAYPADTGDMDGDTLAEVQNDGLYYEFASGGLRLFVIDSLRYSADTRAGGATPAGAFPGFVARTADTPAATYGSCPSGSWPNDGTDTYEDNSTMGGEQTQWFVNRTAAMTEAFGLVASHRIVGGYAGNTYFYQRGSVATGDTDGDGRIETTEPWDTDRDGDLSDEHYIADRMAVHGLQLRLNGHDHHHVICRKGSVHYIAVGRPLCPFGSCWSSWLLTDMAVANVQMRDSYDCDEDGRIDSSPSGTLDGLGPSEVQNQGLTGANGTLNAGFGLLTVNGSTSMTWEWVVTDLADPERNNDTVIRYGPISP